MTRVIIGGSRLFSNKDLLYREVDKILCDIYDDKIEIVSGHARGADTLGESYAHNRRIPLTIFFPNWARYGKSAGCIRNNEMAKYASQANRAILIAFIKGESRGTKNMIQTANKYKIKIYVIEEVKE